MERPKIIRDTTKEAWDYILSVLSNVSTAPVLINDDTLEVCRPVMENEEWCQWPASAKQHHCRVGGLLEHTAEVLRFALASVATVDKLPQPEGVKLTKHGYPFLDVESVVTAVIWHDVMKTRDYTCVADKDDPSRIRVSHHPYHQYVHHIPGGYAAFVSHFENLAAKRSFKLMGFNHIKPCRRWMEKVGHIILSHHGRTEWGSPVEPISLEAIIVHQADTMSARYDHIAREPENSKHDK